MKYLIGIMLIGLLASCNCEGTWVLKQYEIKNGPLGESDTYKINTKNGDTYYLSQGKWKKLEHE